MFSSVLFSFEDLINKTTKEKLKRLYSIFDICFLFLTKKDFYEDP